MASATTIYVAPATRGSGDGSSAANAHAMAAATDVTWLTGKINTWSTELVANPNDVGINEATTFRTVKPGLEPGYGDKSYLFDTRTAVFVRRVCFLTDVGNYTWWLGATNSLAALIPIPFCVPQPADPLTAGTSGQPAIRLLHIVGYRNSDGQMAHQVAGSPTSRTVAIPTKTGSTSSWTDSANYTRKGSASDANAMTNWNGGAADVNYTWTVADPSPIRAIFVGNRTPDTRTQTEINNKVMINVGNNPINAYDPDGVGTEPELLDGSGNNIVLNVGQKVDPTTKVVTTVFQPSAFVIGGYAFGLGGGAVSNVVIQGFEFRDMGGGISYGGQGTNETHFHGFRDLKAINTKYVNWRGNYHYDVEFTRVLCIGTSQKHFNMGQYNQRWSWLDIRTSGNWMVGDTFPALISAQNGNLGTENSFGAGCLRFENVIIENLWGGTVVGTQKYVNGDGIDLEIDGVAIRNYYVDLCPDGAIDNKTKPYWANWNSIIIFNGYYRRNKRCFRSWAPAGYPERNAPHVMRNVTVAGARQYGIFMRAGYPHHKFISFYNADGRANFVDYHGESYVRVSNDGNNDGDQDCVIHQCYDAGDPNAVVSTFLNSNTAMATSPAGPFRCRLWTPIAPPPTLVVSVNGSVRDDGSVLQETTGGSFTVHPTGVTGGQYTYLVNGNADIARSGDDATITVHL